MESILPQWQHAQLDTEGAAESKASLREEVATAAARVSAGLVTWAETTTEGTKDTETEKRRRRRRKEALLAKDSSRGWLRWPAASRRGDRHGCTTARRVEDAPQRCSQPFFQQHFPKARGVPPDRVRHRILLIVKQLLSS